MFGDKKTTVAMLMAVVFFVVADRLLKAWVTGFKPEINLIGGWLRVVLAKNTGIAFSLPAFGQGLIFFITLIIITLIYIFILKMKKAVYFEAVLYLAIILGAASNLYDRLKFGYVIDYFSLVHFSVFNLADSLILFGIAGIVWLGLNKKH